jgi:hypothetical protein
MTVVDASTDDGSDEDILAGDGNSSLQISVDWGDGSVKSTGARGTTFNRTYTKTGTFPIIVKATDSKLKSNSLTTCSPNAQATPAYFSIMGTVKNKAGSANIGSASVTVMQGTTVIKTVTTAANGTFTAASLKPGSYNLKVTKSGYTFANPAASKTVGPSSVNFTDITIKATN